MNLPRWRYRPSRRALVVASVVVGVVLGVWLSLAVAYPRIGAWIIRSRVLPKIGARLGRDVAVADIDLGLGHGVLRNLTVRGPHDGDQPLARVDRIDVRFDFARSLVGSVQVDSVIVDGVAIAARRDAAGADNFMDLATQLRRADRHGVRGQDVAAAGLGIRPQTLEVRHVRGRYRNDAAGITLDVADGAFTAAGGPRRGALHGITVVTDAGPGAGVAEVEVTEADGGRVLEVKGGHVEAWRGQQELALTDIAGTIREADQGRYQVALKGSYGGAGELLWTAAGWVSPADSAASILVDAERFYLGRLDKILRGSPLVNYDKSWVDARLQLDVDRDAARFSGGFHVSELTVFHPMLAEKEVPNLDITGDIVGSYDRRARVLKLERGDFLTRGLPVQLTGQIALPGGLLPDGTKRAQRAVAGRVVVPPVKCQQALDAIPTEMTPYLAGFKLIGTFSADVRLAIDWANLQATELDGSVGLFRCTVKEAPEEVGTRFLEPFEHWVEVGEDEWISFIVGPENPDYVPITEISPNLVKSILTTEDNGFYRHHGFIPSEFKTALIKDLEAGYFKYGASSITMQLVKNILLYREKTLTRKLQELFLTWYIETVLPKDRILEIYFNVIEYGPGIYGIGPAARHYFGKHPRDLNPREAAFFSTILPGPKQRYRQYCRGELRNWTQDKIDRILKLMLDRQRITPEEYQLAMTTALVFAKDGNETVDECLKRVDQAIKKTRPTNPMNVGAPKPGPPKAGPPKPGATKPAPTKK